MVETVLGGMRQTFTITGRLDGMNDFISANRSTSGKGRTFWCSGAQMKKDNQLNVAIAIRKAHLKPITGRCRLHYRFFEPNMKRDLDNISGFAHKVVQDALVETGILENDGWKQIAGYTDDFFIDKEDPRIEVTIIYMEQENGTE